MSASQRISADLLFVSFEHVEALFDLNGERVPAERHIEELSALLAIFRLRRTAHGIVRHHSIIGAPLPKSAICVEHEGTSLRSANGTLIKKAGSNKS